MFYNKRLRYTHDNPVPSQDGDALKGQTTMTYELDEFMKSVLFQ